MAVTQGVRVEVRSAFVAERSSPPDDQYFFAYSVRVTNEGERAVQLVSRHWIITDAGGRIEEVRGPGVVGQQPTIRPGESFEYTSGCPLATSYGTMHGSYQMVRDDGAKFDADIAPFELEAPNAPESHEAN